MIITAYNKWTGPRNILTSDTLPNATLKMLSVTVFPNKKNIYVYKKAGTPPVYRLIRKISIWTCGIVQNNIEIVKFVQVKIDLIKHK